MYLIRDTMHCKPGQVKPMVEKFKELSKLMKKMGYGSFRILTDFSGDRYWTVVSEQETESFEAMMDNAQKAMSDPKLQKVMKGYHELVEWGHREIYKIEE